MHTVIKTEDKYKELLARIHSLLAQRDQNLSDGEREEVEILQLLISDYENRNSSFTPPSPVEAIRFRMEQANLSQRDLIPFIGSRSKVSEILSGKRSLSLPMIRALHDGLGIPLEVLVQTTELDENESKFDVNRYPIQEMIRRNWITTPTNELDLSVMIEKFIGSFVVGAQGATLFRQSDWIRSGRSMDRFALAAWCSKVCAEGRKMHESSTHPFGGVTEEIMHGVSRLSVRNDGPIAARSLLLEKGVALVVEPHLPKTYVDGAAFLLDGKLPVIGLSVRYDRLDSFWFTLMHELAHISLHLSESAPTFIDDLDFDSSVEVAEQEADALAREVLVPQSKWEVSAARRLKSVAAAQQLANKLEVHPAIVAGRMRHEFNSYRVLNPLVGHGLVRIHFPNLVWTEL